MTSAPSLWNFIANADFLVKLVMLILLIASLCSWTIIIQRFLFLKKTIDNTQRFEQKFWSGIELEEFEHQLSEKDQGIAHIFRAGLAEFRKLQHYPELSIQQRIDGIERAMQVAQNEAIHQLEQHISFLATVGSTSPYIGLFGTVWGIMSAFRALGNVEQASISMVAPGISEALITTAIGLFAAIPAVIAYNRFANQLQRLHHSYDGFKDSFINILQRQF